jgi:hypothetical protein
MARNQVAQSSALVQGRSETCGPKVPEPSLTKDKEF